MKNWYCIYTKARQEDLVCKKLLELPDIDILNPKLKRKKYVRSRLTNVVEELFPCYVFSKFDPYRYFHTVKYTRGVRRMVGDAVGSPYIVDEQLIDCIRSRMENGLIRVEHPDFTTGEKVVIMDGPFSGLSGVFLGKLNAHERVMVLLNTLQAQTRIEIDRALIARG